MGTVLKTLTGGLLGGSDKKSSPAPQSKAAVESPRSDIGANTDAQAAEAKRNAGAARRKRVQAQTQTGKATGQGLRTQLSSAPTRSGVSIQ